MNITQIIKQIKKQEHSITQLTKTCFEKIEKTKHLNSFITIDTNNALEKAKELDQEIKQGKPLEALTGISFAVKDNIHVKGMPSSAGTPALKDCYPKEDSPVVAKLRQAGAIVLGKTNMHELAFGITGYNHAFYNEHIGVRNAYNQNKIAGGSSSGSAVAVATDSTVFALGTDTGGSVRIPAALNNIIGFRPTIGRYSKDGIVPISHTRDTVGFMAKSMNDIIYLDNLIVAEPLIKLNETIRLGFDETQGLANASVAVKKNWQHVKDKLNQINNIELVAINLADVYKFNSLVSFPVALYEAHTDMLKYLKKYVIDISLEDIVNQIVSPDVKDTYTNLVLAKKLPTPDGNLIDAEPIYKQAIEEYRPNLIANYRQIFKQNQLDAVISPTTVAEALDAISETTTLENFSLFIQNTDPTSNAGFPSITIPAGKTDTGLPLGLLIDGLPNEDQKLLAIANEIEEFLP